MIHFFAFSHDSSTEGKKIFDYIYWIILIYIVSLFLKSSPVVSNILMAAIVILAFLSTSPKNYLSLIRSNKITLGFIVFFIYQLGSVFFSANVKAGFDSISLRSPLFLFPLAFSLIQWQPKNWQRLLLFYAFTTFTVSVIGFLYGAFLAFKTKDTGYFYNDNICDLLFGKQAAYFSFYVSAAIFILTDFLLKGNELIKKYKGILFVFILWLLFYCFLLASKTAILSLLLILFILLLTNFIRRKKWMELGIFFFSLIIGFIVLNKLFPKTFHRFKGLNQTEYNFSNKNTENHFNADFDKEKWNSTNTRLAIWSCAIELIKEKPLFGTGIGEKKMDLQSKYKEKNFIYAFNTEKNTHNQYLDIAVSMGIVGLLLFIIVLVIIPLYYFFKNKNTIAICISISLAFALLTENMLDRYQGEIIIGLLMAIVSRIVLNNTNLVEMKIE